MLLILHTVPIFTIDQWQLQTNVSSSIRSIPFIPICTGTEHFSPSISILCSLKYQSSSSFLMTLNPYPSRRDISSDIGLHTSPHLHILFVSMFTLQLPVSLPQFNYYNGNRFSNLLFSLFVQYPSLSR